VSSDTAAGIAIAAAAIAVVALLICALLARRLRRLRSAQQLIAGEGGERTLIEHANDLEQRLGALGREVTDSIASLQGADVDLDRRLQGAITQLGVVRYDAMGEMTGRQSSSVALLDSHGTGVVFSSILHREQARLYVKPINAGQSEFDLSPEEQEALEAAMRK
jgi:Protein of unknown function (DUF4446)